MLFTVINAAALESGMGGFRYQTEEEEDEELVALVEHYKGMGIFN